MKVKSFRSLFFNFPAGSLIVLLLLSQLACADDQSLDPEEGRYFILSVAFELEHTPRPPQRITIVSKVVNFGRSPNGFGLSLKAFNTSVRPQVYWSGADGSGGFYTFGDISFKARQRYVLTLVAFPKRFLALYIEPRSSTPTSQQALGDISGKIRFLGGQEISNVSTPKNNAELNYKSPEDYGEARSERANVLGVLIATPRSFKDSRDRLTKELRGAPELLIDNLERGSIRLWELSVMPKSSSQSSSSDLKSARESFKTASVSR